VDRLAHITGYEHSFHNQTAGYPEPYGAAKTAGGFRCRILKDEWKTQRFGKAAFFSAKEDRTVKIRKSMTRADRQLPGCGFFGRVDNAAADRLGCHH